MGAGGGKCDGARVELRRPGLSAGGVGISIDFSTGRGTGSGLGASFWAIGAMGALLAFAGEAMSGVGFEVGLMVVSDEDLGFAFDVGAGCLGVALSTGFDAGAALGLPAFGTPLGFTAADLAATTALAWTFGTTFTADFLLATGLAGAVTAGLTGLTGLTTALVLPAFSTGFTTDLVAGLTTVLAVALLFWLVLAAAFAGVADFFVTAFTGCLLWEAASG